MARCSTLGPRKPTELWGGHIPKIWRPLAIVVNKDYGPSDFTSVGASWRARVQERAVFVTIAIDPDTENAARLLARLRGETIEEAVKRAVRAELARAEQASSALPPPDKAGLVQRTMAMIAAIPPFEIDSNDPTGVLYDDRGAPR